MPTLQVVRRILLAVLMVGLLGTAVELLLLKHFEGWIQLVPLASIALALAALARHAFRPSRGSLLAFQVVMGLFLAAGLAGIFFHFRANLQYQREFDPALHGAALVWQTERGPARAGQYTFIPMNANTAADADLLTVPGSNQAWADKLKAGRPYKTAADLEKAAGKTQARFFVIE